ncbi:MAG: glycosyltransferase family 2 protein, partial [Thermoplasmatota archaeon]
MKRAVAIAARNEQRTIASVVMLSREHADRVLVVDDGSTDRTALLARLAGAEVISHGMNKGKGGAIATALRWAKREDVDVIVFVDGDGQHDPGHIPELLGPIERGEVDITIGSRWHHDQGLKEMPVHRILGNWVLSQATSLSLSKLIRDSQSGFRAFHIRTLDSFLHSMETGFAVESEMITLADAKGYTWKEVGITAQYDSLDANTQGSWTHGFSVLGRVMRVLRVHRPVRFFGLLSIMMLLLSTGVTVFSRIMYPGWNLLPPGALFIVVALYILAGFFFFSGIMLSGVNKLS